MVDRELELNSRKVAAGVVLLASLGAAALVGDAETGASIVHAICHLEDEDFSEAVDYINEILDFVVEGLERKPGENAGARVIRYAVDGK